MNSDAVKEYILNHTDFKLMNIECIGSGASGAVFKAKLENEPYHVAVKCSKYPELLQKEYDQIQFISDRVECKLPKLYSIGSDNNGSSFMVMEYFDGIGGDKIKNFFKASRVLPNQIVDNLLKIHSVHNDKFGPIDNAVYDTWYDYYSKLAKEIYDFAVYSYENGKIRKKVMEAVELSYSRLDKILQDDTGIPTLIHGDYWQPNFVVNPKTYELVGVIDPFNIMWTEPEYELFALATGAGARLKLYENYKSRIIPSRYCDLKLEMYALYNELLWHKKLGTYNNSYLLYRSKRLIRQLKRNHLI